MFGAFTSSDFRRLFLAQVVALLGTGMLTVALSLLAYDLADDRAGEVLGLAFAIKMVAYVFVTPVAGALLANLSRKWVLVGADLVRCGMAICLLFVDAIWQIYLLIFLLQAASASFTPVFQAAIADLLPDERQYTSALSLSRAAYDLESLLSPLLAGVFLAFASYSGMFGFTFVGFAISAVLIVISTIPAVTVDGKSSRTFRQRLTVGARIYLATPRLRGLLIVTGGAAAVGAFVIVNTVVVVRSVFDGGEEDVALALAAFGAGSLIAAVVMPAVLRVLSDRTLMILAVTLLGVTGLVAAVLSLRPSGAEWGAFLATWLVCGFLFSCTITPTGRLIRRSANDADRPALFAAQFALSHACWLVAYPLAGQLGAILPPFHALGVLGVLAVGLGGVAVLMWPVWDPDQLWHDHDLPPGHPHMQDIPGENGRHSHAYVIDDLHCRWPRHPDAT